MVSALKLNRCDPKMIDVMVDLYMGDRTEIWRNGEVLGRRRLQMELGRDVRGHRNFL